MTREPPEYSRKWTDDLFSPRARGATTLAEGVANAFPDANPKKLDKWVKEVLARTGVDPKLLLFSTLICGVYFRLIRPEVRSALEDLWKWLTWHPRNMKPELAELVIEALTPGLMKAIERRGWQRGAKGPYVRQKGHPPTARGVWVAGLLVDHYFRQAGTKKAVVSLVTGLVSVLVGRDVDANEFYRLRKGVAGGAVEEIARRIADQYEHCVEQDGVRAGDLSPSRARSEEYAQWRARHKTLRVVLQDFGCEELAWLVLDKIPGELWEPLWGSKWREDAG